MRTNHIILEIHFAKIIFLGKNKFSHKMNQNNQYLKHIHRKNVSINIPVAAKSAKM